MRHRSAGADHRAAGSLLFTLIIVAAFSTGTAVPAPSCPGPDLCGITCSVDASSGAPIYCSNGQCACAPGYETVSGQGGLLCWPHQPEFEESFSQNQAVCGAGYCTAQAWGTVGGISSPFDLVAVHGTSPGGEAFMPVWGKQANACGTFGVSDDAGSHSWLKNDQGACTPDPGFFCHNIANSDEVDFSPPSCDNREGCPNGAASYCVSDFTSAWPFLDKNYLCQLAAPIGCPVAHALCGDLDPSRVDFPNNVVVYRAPIVWENHSAPYGLDDDYTMNLYSRGAELYDTQAADGRIHVEFDSDETIDHFTDDDWGAANKWWRDLRDRVDHHENRDVRCFMRSFIDPNLTCPQPEHSNLDGEEPSPLDPLTVVVGVPSVDCADHPDGNTAEIHPAYAVAVRIQQDPNKPERWAFFYRESGDNGGCGSHVYGRCDMIFQLPLSFPSVPAGKVLKSADVHVDYHPWSMDDSPPSGIAVASHFDLASGTVLSITLPKKPDVVTENSPFHIGVGVVGLVTVTPAFDTAPPQISCPADIVKSADLGKCTAAVSFTPTVSDDCLVLNTVCTSPSGTAFPIGTTTDTCSVVDQANQSSSCSFTVTTTVGNTCPQASGYWKNNANLWAVNALTLGSVSYTKTQLIGVLNRSTAGDASVTLGKALISALLSQAGGSNPVPICGVMADANAALDGCTVPCGIGAKTTRGQAMIGLANTLDTYNNRKLTPNCTP